MRVCLVACVVICVGVLQALAGSSKPSNKYRTVVTFGGGNGSFYDTAIVIHAPDQVSGFPSEFMYIKGHFVDFPYVLKEQREKRNNKVYDVITLAAYDWRRRLVYFDITEFFQKK